MPRVTRKRRNETARNVRIVLPQNCPESVSGVAEIVVSTLKMMDAPSVETVAIAVRF